MLEELAAFQKKDEHLAVVREIILGETKISPPQWKQLPAHTWKLLHQRKRLKFKNNVLYRQIFGEYKKEFLQYITPDCLQSLVLDFTF